MSEQEALALYRMFWALVGFPCLFGINIAAIYFAWEYISDSERGE